MNVELLDNKTHKEIRVESKYFPGLGYNSGAAMLLPNEILDAQREYPIVFRKHPESGEFFINVLLGFEQDQNLFIDEKGGWNADYLPFSVAKGPFMIGVKEDAESGERRPVLSIVRDDPRVGSDAGERLFDDDGNTLPYLETINAALAGMHAGMPQLKPLIDSFMSCELIEPLNLNIEFKDGTTCDLPGMYTVSEERLRALSEQQLCTLNKEGHLAAAFYISGSLSNFYKLTRMRNARV